MRTLLRWLSLGICLLHFTAAAQTAPPFRIGLNFAFVGATNTTLAQAFTNIVPLGLRGTRHSTPADVNWTSLQTRSNVPPNFTNADQVFFNSNGLAVLGTLYDDPNPSTSTGLQVPWITGSGFNFTSNELYYASNYVRSVVTRYAGVSHYWEISNEVDGQTNRPRSLPPSEFASFLITNRNWIRAVDPQAQVVLPGCLGNYAASNLGTGVAAGVNLSNLDLTTSSGASQAIQVIDAALDQISSARGNIGSFQSNILQSNIRSLGVAEENLSAANSTIRDTDVASEMTSFTKEQILQQTGMSVLAQANSQPQSVLKLLQ